jgi:DNA repair protein RadC
MCQYEKSSSGRTFGAVGGLNMTIVVVPRKLFMAIILANSASFIFSHHHPRQNVEPSAKGISMTHQLVEYRKVLGIKVMDRVIVKQTLNHVENKDEGEL